MDKDRRLISRYAVSLSVRHDVTVPIYPRAARRAASRALGHAKQEGETMQSAYCRQKVTVDRGQHRPARTEQHSVRGSPAFLHMQGNDRALRNREEALPEPLGAIVHKEVRRVTDAAWR